MMLADASVLLIGYGRISRVLETALKALGANVYIASRNTTQGANMVQTGNYSFVLQNCDAIVNTAPALVLTGEELRKIRRECLILDLASAPGGVDQAAAQTLGHRVLWELGLPGREFPISAGRIIKESVHQVLAQKGV